MLILRLLILFVIGLSVWLLTLGRSFAWDTRRAGLLVGVIMTDELIGIWIGMYLSRQGQWYEAVPCALGGAMAALLMLRRANRGRADQ